ncbi:E3 ubiquitin-protein ligase Os03g0188200-like [Lolium rigidum]|uniref:E3 ubiquitin-protein ligase Os03g0188200-like n=1 Tax=Lolium rigidum TaxID=89674 RepID=UPI001F5D6694|nr:E3 ubiquitin-protein ligase Os03g0188200-like [Lolium rigidum]
MAPGKMALLLVLILVSATQPSLAQQSNGTRIAGGFTPTTMAMLIVVIATLVLLALFSLYMNRCACARTDLLARWPFRSTAPDDQSLDSGHCRPRGLDREQVEAFPTAVYGDVKAHMAPGTKPVSLECAVCLAEFADADELRVLPACCHVFHPGCIDPWLAGAVTCPLCRADLTDLTPTGQQEESSGEKHDECSVVSFTATAESLGSFSTVRKHELTDADYSRYRRTRSAIDAPDRHTLRLPEHVMKELGAVWRHRLAASFAAEHLDAVDQRTPGRLTSFLRSMSWQRHHGTELEAGEEHGGGGNKRIYPVAGALPVETPSGSGSGVDEKKESSKDDANLDGLKEIGRDLIEFTARWLELVAGVEFVWRRRGEVRWCKVQFSPPTSPSTLYK